METKKDTKEKMKLLLVEDDKFLLDMYNTKLKESFEVTSACSAIDALSQIEGGFEPEIILTDIVMPSMDGFEFLAEIKKKKLATSAVKIILSNLGQKDDIDKGASLGAHGYIVKAMSTPTETVKKIIEITEAAR